MSKLPDYHIELYKIAVQSADQVSGRRAAANSFFLTIHSVLASLLGYASTSDKLPAGFQPLGLAVAAIVGLLLCVTWWIMLRSFRDLNNAKYTVIQKMEAEFDIKPFTEEWEILKKDPVKTWRKRYAEFSSVERIIPFAFGLIYAVILAGALIYNANC